ncbi:HYR domain-containing protein [Nitrosopumilus sp. K4]|uniref:HYR domain-containing protein n=1 Tax=Nitrosopumilus sp. K4 TaxID=2795383 RepID=UPI001BAA540E|nr:HYR domain-containing protein [Nitrosopumilus sp. K4]QUC64050.1 HYR domain-containing protein [Nitrosopumilus sp. K4]
MLSKISFFAVFLLVITIGMVSIPPQESFATSNFCSDSPGFVLVRSFGSSLHNVHYWVFLLPPGAFGNDIASLTAASVAMTERHYGTGEATAVNGVPIHLQIPSNLSPGTYRVVTWEQHQFQGGYFGPTQGSWSNYNLDIPCPPPNFRITTNPASYDSMQQGFGAASFSVRVSMDIPYDFSGFPVVLSTSGLPPNLSSSIVNSDTLNILPPFPWTPFWQHPTTLLNILQSGTPLGIYNFNLVGTSEGTHVNRPLQVEVLPPPDADNDGYCVSYCGIGIPTGDCNDNDPSVYPGAPELIDGKDNNCDGQLAYEERDDDNDGVLNVNDACPLDPYNDQDSDGICGDVDLCPLDTDNDADNDGYCADVDNCPAIANADQANIDGDQHGDACDPDSDNDTIPDVDDPYPLDATACGDADLDACDDCVSGTFDTSNDGPDYDSDLICDIGDPDDDNDGVPDPSDLDPLNQFICTDSDADSCDDCSVLGYANANDDGTDTDTDGLCNVGDPDDDNDGVPDPSDLDPLNQFICTDSDADSCDDCSVLGYANANDDGTDTDTDGLCNVGDPDDDNDGVPDPSDLDPLNQFICTDSDADSCDDCSVLGFANVANDGPDNDSDSLCDVGDPDDDNDGIEDDVDSQPLIPSTEFNDGTTSGEITYGENSLTISNAGVSGVNIVSTGDASVSTCGGSASATFSSGDNANVLCGSVTIEVISGSVDLEFVTGGEPATTTLNSGDSLTFDPETLQITSVDTSATITIGGTVLHIGPGETLQIDIIPPTFDPISDIVVDATSVDGAIVDYPLPTATDNIDPNPTVSCTPQPGSIFAIGVNTVSCTATDLVGNSVDAEFSITVQITFDSLKDTVNSFDLQKGLTTSLVKKIEAASASFDRDNIKAATNQLHAFINEVNAQDGKTLTSEQTESLSEYAELLITHISNP